MTITLFDVAHSLTNDAVSDLKAPKAPSGARGPDKTFLRKLARHLIKRHAFPVLADDYWSRQIVSRTPDGIYLENRLRRHGIHLLYHIVPSDLERFFLSGQNIIIDEEVFNDARFL